MKTPKILYIEAVRKKQEGKLEIDAKNLPKEIFLAYSIQYKNTALAVEKYLKNKGIKIKGIQQVLGCTKLKLKTSTPILLIGSGKFHALNLALQNKAGVYVYNSCNDAGMSGGIEKIQEKEVEKLKIMKRAALSAFIQAEKIGIIISAKPGQKNLDTAAILERKIKERFSEKKVYRFISSSISINELENFDVQSWINTACPGLAYDETKGAKIANSEDILAFLTGK